MHIEFNLGRITQNLHSRLCPILAEWRLVSWGELLSYLWRSVRCESWVARRSVARGRHEHSVDRGYIVMSYVV